MWGPLIAEILKFFGPLLLSWLRDLLERSQPTWHTRPEEHAAAVGELFAAARRNLTWWDKLRGRGRVLDRLERKATAHAAELVRAARGEAAAPVLTAAEVQELQG